MSHRDSPAATGELGLEAGLQEVKQRLGPHLWEREWATIENLLESLGLSVPDSGSVLDLGSGLGEMRFGAEQRGLRYRALDERDANFESDRLPIQSDSVDLVLCLAVVEHLIRAENLISETYRILRPGGVAFFSTPNWHYSSDTFFDNPGHVHPYTPRALKLAFGAFRFEGVWAVPGLRMKNRWWYFHKFAFPLAAHLPYSGQSSAPVPSWLKGRSKSFFLIALKPVARKNLSMK